MQNDILPPKRPSENLASRQPMRSTRLRGQSMDSALGRLSMVKPAPGSQTEPIETVALDPDPPVEHKPPKKSRFAWWHRQKRYVKIALIVVLLLIIAGGAFLIFHSQPAKKPPVAAIKTAPKVVPPTTVASPLTGLQVAPALASRPVTGIMIENSDAARPQSGLQDAGAVFEAIAEGGVTRFLALFQDATPQYIGPVRSLRPYYIDYAAGFQARIVHVGGSPDALAEVQSGNYRNLDEFASGSYFNRISSREAPHNVYTSFSELDKLNQSKGYTSSSYTSWVRKADQKIAVPTAKTIQFAISGPDFYDNYTYNPTTNSYLRSEGGAAHMDLTSASDTKGVQLNPKVVIAIVVPLSNGALDATGAYYSDYTDIGTGVAYVFQDGGETTGTWTKTSGNSQIQFTDSGGQGIKLDAGQVWTTLVSASSQVTYSP